MKWTGGPGSVFGLGSSAMYLRNAVRTKPPPHSEPNSLRMITIQIYIKTKDFIPFRMI